MVLCSLIRVFPGHPLMFRRTTACVATIWILGLFVFVPPCSVAQQPTSETGVQPIDFAAEVRPIFENHCYACHGPEKQESNFRLDVRSLALGSADFGDPPIVPGHADESPLIEFVTAKAEPAMPPEDSGKRLDKQQIKILRQWINQGAQWPDELAGEQNAELTTDHWSFQPLGNHAPPVIDVRAAGKSISATQWN